MNLRLGFLASHGGSNMAAILQAIHEGTLTASAQVVISNNPSANALKIAETNGTPGFLVNEKTEGSVVNVDERITSILRNHDVNVVILNGYMKKIGPQTLSTFAGKILNIHPSLLPKFGGQGMFGLRVHEAVLSAGEVETGATIHVIDEEYDRGRILAQTRVAVCLDDSPETLAMRVQAAERILYVDTLRQIEASTLSLDDDHLTNRDQE